MYSFYVRRSHVNLFLLSGSTSLKAASKTLVKLTPELCEKRVEMSSYFFVSLFHNRRHISLTSTINKVEIKKTSSSDC